MIKKSITITEQQAEWIEGELAKGGYASDSELIREALREKQARQAEIDYLRKEIQKGLDSGISSRTMEEIREEALEMLRSNGDI